VRGRYPPCPSTRYNEYIGDNTWGRILKQAVKGAGLPFRYTPYQICHTPQGQIRRYNGGCNP
jgi:hypothetical protein